MIVLFYNLQLQGTYLEISWVRKVVAGSHFKVFVYFLIFKSQLLGMRVLTSNFFVKSIAGSPWAPAGVACTVPGLLGLQWGWRQRVHPCPQEPFPLIVGRDMGERFATRQAHATLSGWGFLSLLSELSGG